MLNKCLERFLDKVRPEANGCWRWTASILPNGYGKFWGWHQDGVAHRYAYEYFVGPIPMGLQIDHLCRNRWCVNPLHLEPVTQRENLLRGDTVVSKNARATHCPVGHPYDDSNTYWWRGSRHCYTCRARQVKEHRLRSAKGVA